jgi:DNA-binding transcriptional MerR regulator
MAKTKDVADRIGVSTATIRIWTAEDGPFSPFISEEARGGQGRTQRNFSPMDMRVMAHAKTLSDSGLTLEQVAEALAIMQDGGWVDLPAMPAMPGEDVSMVPAQAAEVMVRNVQHALQVAEGALEKEKTAHEQTRERLLDAREQIGELRGRLAALRLYQVVLIVLAIVAALAILALVLPTIGAG